MTIQAPEQGSTASGAHGVGEEKIGRIPHHRLIPRAEPLAGHHGQPGGGAVDCDHPCRAHINTPLLAQIGGHGSAKRGQPAWRSIAEHPTAGIADHSLSDHGSRGKIGVCGRKRNHPFGLLRPAHVVSPLAEQLKRNDGIVEAKGFNHLHLASGNDTLSSSVGGRTNWAAMERPACR